MPDETKTFLRCRNTRNFCSKLAARLDLLAFMLFVGLATSAEEAYLREASVFTTLKLLTSNVSVNELSERNWRVFMLACSVSIRGKSAILNVAGEMGLRDTEIDCADREGDRNVSELEKGRFDRLWGVK